MSPLVHFLCAPISTLAPPSVTLCGCSSENMFRLHERTRIVHFPHLIRVIAVNSLSVTVNTWPLSLSLLLLLLLLLLLPSILCLMDDSSYYLPDNKLHRLAIGMCMHMCMCQNFNFCLAVCTAFNVCICLCFCLSVLLFVCIWGFLSSFVWSCDCQSVSDCLHVNKARVCVWACLHVCVCMCVCVLVCTHWNIQEKELMG